MKSRISWLVDEDCNATFYLTSVLNRRRRNKITSIDQREVLDFIKLGFTKLYTTEMESG